MHGGAGTCKGEAWGDNSSGSSVKLEILAAREAETPAGAFKPKELIVLDRAPTDFSQ